MTEFQFLPLFPYFCEISAHHHSQLVSYQSQKEVFLITDVHGNTFAFLSFQGISFEQV